MQMLITSVTHITNWNWSARVPIVEPIFQVRSQLKMVPLNSLVGFCISVLVGTISL